MDIREKGGALTDTEEEAQDTNPQDMDNPQDVDKEEQQEDSINPQDVDKEEQQEDSIDTVSKASGTITTGSTAPATKQAFSMDFTLPYIIYDNEAKKCKAVTADSLVAGMNERFLHPKVNQDGTELHVQVGVP